MAIPKEKSKLIEKLLKEQKLSKRAISRKLGISRVTIDRIEKKLLFPEEEQPQIRILHFTESDNCLTESNRPKFSRCTGCGGQQQVGVPCLVCSTRKQQMLAYDCYMDELLSPQVLSPLSPQRRG